MSKDDEVGGAELRGEVEQRNVPLEASDDPQRTANLPQPELKVTAADAFNVTERGDEGRREEFNQVTPNQHFVAFNAEKNTLEEGLCCDLTPWAFLKEVLPDR